MLVGWAHCPAPCSVWTQCATELSAIKANTNKPFNVNFFCHAPPTASTEREAAWRASLAPYYQEHGIDVDTIAVGPGRSPFSSEAADVLEEFKPAVVSFHFGLPSGALLARVRAWGSKIVSSATTVEEAIWLEARGVDAIIAQGLEAGGHRGRASPMRRALQLPSHWAPPAYGSARPICSVPKRPPAWYIAPR